MPTNKNNRHKLPEFRNLINKDINILQESAVTEEEKPLVGIDGM